MPFDEGQRLYAETVLEARRGPTHSLGVSWHGKGIGRRDYARKQEAVSMRHTLVVAMGEAAGLTTHSHEVFEADFFPEFCGEERWRFVWSSFKSGQWGAARPAAPVVNLDE